MSEADDKRSTVPGIPEGSPTFEDLEYSYQPGEKVGDCLIIGAIGRGGMGQVYRVKHLYLDKELALKSLCVNDSELKLRFTKEARALARLRHPNIVQIYDFFEDGHGHLCYSMELIEGLSFSRFLKKNGPLNEQLTAAIFVQVFDALQYAHSAGLTHRDIKPANIMVLNQGTANQAPLVQLVDFGLVKLQEDFSAQGLTKQGDILGSPLYMSPEQCSGNLIGPASDLYSAGCSMHDAENAPANTDEAKQ